MKRHGLLIVLSSPSGGGKTTIAQRLLRRDKHLVRSVSCTTRKARTGEKNGRDYFFVSRARFQKMKAQRAFLEWAKVHGELYGTLKSWVEREMGKGKDVLFVIDVQGGRSLKKLYPKALLIFLKPPGFSVLRKRLLGRKSEGPQALKLRLQDARREMKQSRSYHYRVVNDRLLKAVSDVAKIIQKERSAYCQIC